MLEAGIRPNAETLNILISACARAGQPFRAVSLKEEMARKHGVPTLLVQHCAAQTIP
jgi:pentatricopeptide repeat protein